MKKLLAVLAAAIMVMGLSVTAFAAPSPSSAVTVSGDVASVSTTTQEMTVADAQAIIGGDVQASQLNVVWQADITATKLPATLSFTASGTAAPQKIYVFHYVDGAWKLEGSGDPQTVTITCDSVSPFAVVVYTPAGGKSPKTGETNTLTTVAMISVVVAGAALAFVLAPKKKRD